MYSLVKNTKYSFRKQRRNRLRSTFYWHHVPQDEIVQNMETRGRSKLRLRLHGSGRIPLQIAVLFACDRNFCTVSALEWLFWISSALHSTNHVKLSPDCDNSEFTQQAPVVQTLDSAIPRLNNPGQDGKKEKDGKMRVCDKRDRTITCMCCRNLH